MQSRPGTVVSADPLALAAPQFWILFAVLVAAAGLPVLVATLPPLFDYPNHLARMYLLIHQPESAPLRQFYEIAWRPVPNLAMDCLVPALARVMPLAWAGKVFILACFSLLAGGAAALHRVTSGRWSAWPLFACLFLYTRVFLWGLLNYLFGAGLALLALASWIALGERRAGLRLAVAALFALALFFAHLMACAVYAVLVAGYELGQIWSDRPRQWTSAFRRLALAGAQFLPPAAILWRTGQGGGLTAISYGRYVRKLDLLFSVFDNYNRVFDGICFAAVVGFAAFAYGRRWLIVTPALRGPLLLLVLAYFAAPTQLMTATAVDHRLPLVMAVVLMAATAAPSLRSRVALAIACAGIVLFTVRMAVIAVNWHRSDTIYARLIGILDEIPDGARLAVAFPPESVGSQPVPTTHLPTLAVIERNAFVPTLFAYPTQQPIALTPEFKALAARSTPDAVWRALNGPESQADALDALQSYDDVVVLAPHAFALPPQPMLRPIAVEANFALYQIVRPGADVPPGPAEPSP